MTQQKHQEHLLVGLETDRETFLNVTSETRLNTQLSFGLYFERHFRSLPAHAVSNAASVTAQLVHRERGAPCVGAEGRTRGPTPDRPGLRRT